MTRHLLLLCFVSASAALADTPEFQKGGAIISLQYGWGFWNLDTGHLSSQVNPGDVALLAGDVQNGHSATLELGYNILGHATVAASLTATGWNITDANRGGGGFLTGVAHWHPLQIFLKDQPRFYDASLFLGFGYGIMGQHRGMDGFVWQWGLDADVYVSKIFSIGPFFRVTELGFSNFYIDYDYRSEPGNTIPLPQGSGGNFMQLGVALKLRIAP